MSGLLTVVSNELNSSDRIGRQGKRTSNRARTRDLRSIAEFQPHEPSIPIEILRPQSPLSTGHEYAAIQRPLKTRTLRLVLHAMWPAIRPAEGRCSGSVVQFGLMAARAFSHHSGVAGRRERVGVE